MTRRRSSSVALVVGLFVAAFGPVFAWATERWFGAAGEAWPLGAVLVALAIVTSRLRRVPDAIPDAWLLAAAVPCLAFALVPATAPPAARAALVFLAAGLLLLGAVERPTRHAGVLVLVLGALPIGPELEAAFSYPLRALAGDAAVGLLAVNGIDATRDGTLLRARDVTIFLDPDCAGLRKLWVLVLLAAALAALQRHSAGRTATLVLAALLTGWCVNVGRYELLLLGAARSPTADEAIGLGSFALGVALVSFLSLRPVNRASESTDPMESPEPTEEGTCALTPSSP